MRASRKVAAGTSPSPGSSMARAEGSLDEFEYSSFVVIIWACIYAHKQTLDMHMLRQA